MKLGPKEKYNPNNPEHNDSSKYLITYEGDGRHPDNIEIEMSFEKDAERRDFTINAMAIDSRGNIIDHFEGMKAIQSKVLKTVGDPNKRFKEDYLRIMRMARFASRLDYKIDPKAMTAAKQNASNIAKISPERILQEIIKSAKQSGDKFATYLEILHEANILKFILPELIDLKSIEHTIETHPESFKVRKILG